MMKFKNELKRGFSMTVALAMCMGSLQVTALADETPDTGVISNGGSSSDAASDVSEGSDTASDVSEGSDTASEAAETSTGVTDIGVSVEVGEKTTVENADGSTTETTTATGTDKNDNKVDIETSTTTKETEEGTETTDSIKVTITDEGERVEDPDPNKEVLAPTEKEDMEQTNSDKKEDFELGQEVKVEGWVGNGLQHNTTEDLKSQGVDYGKLVEKLKPDTKDWGEEKTDSEGKTYWEKQGEKENQIIRKTIVEITKEVKEADGKSKTVVIGYKTITETITTNAGAEYTETERNPLDPDASLPPVNMEGNEEPGDVATKVPAPEKPVEGTVVDGETITSVVDNEDGSYTVTYEKVTGEPVSTPRVDENGNPVLDENGEQIVDLVYPTETRTETVLYETSEDTYQVEVKEERKDEVIIETVVDENRVDFDQDTLDFDQDSLDLELKLETEDKSEIKAPDENIELPENFIEEMKGLKDYLDKNIINMNFLAGTTVTVTQSKSGSNAYSADATIKLNLNKSQLNKDFVLTVNGTAYRFSEDAIRNEADKILEFDENGNVKDIRLEGIHTGTIDLQLTGKQEFRFTAEDLGWGDCTSSPFPLDNHVDLTARIQVTITEIKGDKVYEQFKGSENEEETKTFKRTDTVTESESTLTTTVTDVAAGTKNDTTTQPVPDDGNEDDGNNNEDDGDNNEDDGNNNNDNTPTTPGDGPANNNTNNVVVADPDVPLAEIPETEVPLAEIPETEVPLAEIPDMEVPLADAPVEMDIPDEAVPMADVPAEVVIVDDAVPLADVPKTGDTSDIWYAAAVLSLGGWMLVSGRKREEEDA